MARSRTPAALATATHTDTTFAVKPGVRLELSNFGGTTAVTTWAKSSVRVVAEHSSRVEIQIDHSGRSLDIQAAHSRGIPTTVEHQITVPRWMALELSGVSTDISVENAEGEVHIESVHGEVSVTGGTRLISASSVEDEATIRGIGSYRFSTHGGDVGLTIPERTNATVSLSTFSGEFSSEFPIELRETRHGKRFDFTLGKGGARIELESFQGSIRLRRPGSPGTKRTDAYRYEYKTGMKTVKDKHKNSGQEEREP